MATTTTTTTSTSSKKKIVWSWQSNPDPWNENEEKVWKYYSDFANEFIEDAHQKKSEGEVQLGDYVIDFRQMLQIRKDNRTKQRPIKREEVNVSRYLREERFCFAEKPMKSFTITQYGGGKFTYGWHERNQVLCYPATRYSEIVEQAANGNFLSLTM
ncbi:unnamed protein product [Didymodactylos carnosus]|uniref:WWE domain-containing protein n=1 Tax=Didymodactylos carnosus TaxID=1234261 RepID=A0A8S2FIN4_9BILA|nr:unnamed protein product [Didymodactylos carnosus]CAF4265527.1 unnamed protein product [Didymodactylos carnosus]